MEDPFRHHPGLRDLVADAEASFFRRTPLSALKAKLDGNGIRTDWWLTDQERNALRQAFLKDHEGDLWVFAYGSLMWDPGLRFSEVRRADIADHARRFILKDIYGGRGDMEKPGLMVALDRVPGASCSGLVFRIAEGDVEAESRELWKRERLGPAYEEAWVAGETAEGPVRAVAFVADHTSDLIDDSMTFEEQVTYAATGSGFLGTSYDYLTGIAAHFREMRIPAPEVDALLGAVDAHRRATMGDNL